MSKLEIAFRSLQEKNPCWSTYACLVNAVIGKGYGKMAIGQAFNRLVEKEDYSRSEKEAILNYTANLSIAKTTSNGSESPLFMGV